MNSPLNAAQTFEREFLSLRAKALEIAAALDRIQRSEGNGTADPRWEKIQSALQILCEPQEGRAERVQLLFSREFDPNWRESFGLAKN
jgi:hypothetical protein